MDHFQSLIFESIPTLNPRLKRLKKKFSKSPLAFGGKNDTH